MNLPLTEWVATHEEERGGYAVMAVSLPDGAIATLTAEGWSTSWGSPAHFDLHHRTIARTLPPPQRGMHESEFGWSKRAPSYDPTLPDDDCPHRSTKYQDAVRWSRGLA